MVSPILTNCEMAAERAAIAQTGETLPERNARLREPRIQAKAAARTAIAARIASVGNGLLTTAQPRLNPAAAGVSDVLVFNPLSGETVRISIPRPQTPPPSGTPSPSRRS